MTALQALIRRPLSAARPQASRSGVCALAAAMAISQVKAAEAAKRPKRRSLGRWVIRRSCHEARPLSYEEAQHPWGGSEPAFGLKAPSSS